MRSIVIIGNGISGVTTARHIRKHSEDKITIISAETEHFYSRTALMYIYMGHMKYENTKPYEDFFWKKNRIDLVYDYVEQIDFKNKKLQLKQSEAVNYDVLVLAVGSKSNKFGWPGQDLEAVQGLYSYQDLEGMEKYSSTTKQAVIVGGGLIGIEMGEMFHTRNIDVTFVVRESSFWDNVLPPGESEMVNRHIRKHGFKLMLESEITEIIDDGNGRAKGVKLKEGGELEAQFVGLTVGVSPNIDFLKDTDLETNKGIKVNEYFETNQPDVYAIGDCAEFEKVPAEDRKSIEQVWYTGRMHGETLAQSICGNKTAYQPGVWFNSAKFLDIEYQTYGQVTNQPNEKTEEHFYWEHEKGEKSIRLVFHKEDKTLKGVNLMGVRYRHEVCDKMIRDKWPMKKVFQNLKKANFDPEFFKRYEDELVGMYNKRYPNEMVKVGRKKVLGLF
ncbi:FAD-dependent oxidoreductase [Marivirga salinae]|uniref:FAD-dependent oxidoreductase n=1 Tax=Marivirga salinarum TaxID=3059078 RepID=A0AA51RDZ9_9BACT|nr:FAD-dependent oxidoreductase [Marivirga sp. BDSF4-3]WMN10650.1 FAD-dependent oxidoreductase [Marivirga sp. BDSF4-3]